MSCRAAKTLSAWEWSGSSLAINSRPRKSVAMTNAVCRGGVARGHRHVFQTRPQRVLDQCHPGLGSPRGWRTPCPGRVPPGHQVGEDCHRPVLLGLVLEPLGHLDPRRMSSGERLGLRPVTRENISSGSPFEPTVGFSRAVRVGDRVMVAGTAPIWPDDQVDPDPKTQARRCLEIMLSALGEAGGSAEDVVRTRMFITDVSHADVVGEAHGEVFGEIRPASTMVVVSGLLDPRWVVEMELDAVLTG